MILEINLTQLIFILIGITSGFWALARVMYTQFYKSQCAQFQALTDILERYQEKTLQLERELLKFQSEIPRTYMRRDDSMREVQELKEMIQRELGPLHKSVGRIEDFLINKPN